MEYKCKISLKRPPKNGSLRFKKCYRNHGWKKIMVSRIHSLVRQTVHQIDLHIVRSILQKAIRKNCHNPRCMAYLAKAVVMVAGDVGAAGETFRDSLRHDLHNHHDHNRCQSHRTPRMVEGFHTLKKNLAVVQILEEDFHMVVVLTLNIPLLKFLSQGSICLGFK